MYYFPKSNTGIWRITLSPVEAGGPYNLTIYQSTTNSSVMLTDVLFGDIWLCGGQSNMAFTVGQVSMFLPKTFGVFIPLVFIDVQGIGINYVLVV